MTSTQISDARLAYECIYGRCSDSHWWRVRQLMKHHKLELTPSNVRFLAELRKHTPRSAIGIDGLLECHKKASEFISKSHRTFKGSEIVAMLDKYAVKPHQSTISRWFKVLGGYKKNQDYSPEQVKSILINAFLYKAQNSTKLPEVI